MERVVVGVEGEDRGCLFVETPPVLWQQRFHAWKRHVWLPCPMPENHLMFDSPRAYGKEPARGPVWVRKDGARLLGAEEKRKLIERGEIRFLPGYHNAEVEIYGDVIEHDEDR